MIQKFIIMVQQAVSIDQFILHCILSFIMLILVFFAVLIDLWDGVYTAKVCGQRIHSHKLRVTINKLGEYWRVLMLGLVIDTLGILIPHYNFPWFTIAMAAGIILIEVKSVFEHIRRRKSALAQLPTIIERIKQCATDRDAQALIDELKNDKQ